MIGNFTALGCPRSGTCLTSMAVPVRQSIGVYGLIHLASDPVDVSPFCSFLAGPVALGIRQDETLASIRAS